MTTIADIEALGIEVPKTKEYEKNAAVVERVAKILDGPHIITKHKADAMRDELLAVIERLVEANRNLHATLSSVKMPPDAAAKVAALQLLLEQAEAEVAAAREERNRLEWALIQHIVDEETDGERYRDQIVELAAQKVADLLARYQPAERREG